MSAVIWCEECIRLSPVGAEPLVCRITRVISQSYSRVVTALKIIFKKTAGCLVLYLTPTLRGSNWAEVVEF